MRQNDHIEAAVRFYKVSLAFHMAGRADRWHEACRHSDKRPATLADAISHVWVQVYDIFHIFVLDCEKGLFTTDADELFKLLGTSVRKRARRGALLPRSIRFCVRADCQRRLADTVCTVVAASCLRWESFVVVHRCDARTSMCLTTAR